jgi:hypothetical protein
MLRVLSSLLALLFLVACTADHKWAGDEAVARARYVHPGPPSITLMTSINTRSQAGAHSALLINGSERVLFDPAGSWDQPAAPERHDVRFGMTPQMLSNYADFQSYAPFELIEQTIIVSPEVAEQAIALAKANGSVEKAQCTRSVGGILRQLPGFEGLPSTWFPKKMSIAFGKMPGVQSQTLHATDGVIKRGVPDGTVVVAPVLAPAVAPAG